MITQLPGIDDDVFVGVNKVNIFLKLTSMEPWYVCDDGISLVIYKVSDYEYYELSVNDNIVFISEPLDPRDTKNSRLRAILKSLKGGDE